MRPAQLALARGEARLVERLAQLDLQLDSATQTWVEYAQLLTALAAIAPLTVPGVDRAMTTRELATAFNLSPRVARRKGLKGELPATPIRLGTGDRAKLRWAAR